MSTVVIVGRKNVGKSTIFNRLIGMRRSVVYKDPGVTRDRIFGEVQWQSRGFDIIDTGGFFPAEEHPLASKITKQIELALNDADLIYFVVDGSITIIFTSFYQLFEKSTLVCTFNRLKGFYLIHPYFS